MDCRAQAATPIHVAGEEVWLTDSRAAWWPRASTLIVADLHLGKSETLAATGVPMPRGVCDEMLRRLGDEVSRWGASRVLVLGDLLHAPAGLAPGLIDQVGEWRAGLGAQIWVVPGNHDRSIDRVVNPWLLTMCEPAIEEEPFRFVHNGDADACTGLQGKFTWCGHVHPAVWLKGNGDCVRLPCFRISPRMGTLPAFSRFTAGAPIVPGVQERIFAVAPGAVVEVTKMPAAAR